MLSHFVTQITELFSGLPVELNVTVKSEPDTLTEYPAVETLEGILLILYLKAIMMLMGY